MRTALPIALLVAVTACHSGPRRGSAPARKNGSYGFRISLTGRDPLAGSFMIAGDSVTVETAGQVCRRDRGRTSPAPLQYFSCFPPAGLDKFLVTIDLNLPFSSSWSMVQSVMKTRTVCVRYTVDARGQRLCAEQRSENYFEDARVGGRLRIIAADTSSH